MNKTIKHFVWLCMLSGFAYPAYAGMPSFTLSDVATLRLSGMSFFALIIILVTFGIKYLWNSLREDFPRLPRLEFRKSLALVILLGLLFDIVLLMISGTREMMTPGAWVKGDTTYQLKQDLPEKNKTAE